MNNKIIKILESGFIYNLGIGCEMARVYRQNRIHKLINYIDNKILEGKNEG
jgi:1-deoxy-D-xylulose 5-phosphate reductoisomerase